MATTIQSASDRTAAVRSTITALHGAGAGMMEALICHPLDGSLRSSIQSIYYQSPLTFYRGLGAVLFGIMPKMAVRFTSFETGLAAAVTEAMLVVTPTEVVKIRLQTAGTHAQGLSSSRFGYRSAPEAMMAIIRTEGVQALWCGVRLTAAQQRTNQAVNLFAYTRIRQRLLDLQPEHKSTGLPSWQTGLTWLFADVSETRIQKEPSRGSEAGSARLIPTVRLIVEQEGFAALYRGTLPRVLQVGIGQAVTFSTYEVLRGLL
ncbi:mitochondrial carrier domain-containing protein [Aspergillus alliaceus]|uniref:mitochondrial carrier domain-containing protein n=1 Tax=Petromyces alliaceus TaxID=209559 RepID=UPI0012A521CC|nr:mitochondrial carrier domain-containing protein [Aspergillus alliaceus]KAB8237754.1 mitochondrial carrier domain-containing protein [Aspergillus alliaceus]